MFQRVCRRECSWSEILAVLLFKSPWVQKSGRSEEELNYVAKSWLVSWANTRLCNVSIILADFEPVGCQQDWKVTQLWIWGRMIRSPVTIHLKKKSRWKLRQGGDVLPWRDGTMGSPPEACFIWTFWQWDWLHNGANAVPASSVSQTRDPKTCQRYDFVVIQVT